MTYYQKSAYKERWYTTFKDLKGGTWRVSIEDPTFSGTSTQLTASANPLEWMGSGDEDQTKCVMGSTGTLRIIVTDEASISGIRPTEMNNRRITAKRNNVLMWQGFVKQEEYSQEWISAPYEVELPIISALELADTMTLPSITSIDTSIQSTAALLRYIIGLLGVDVQHILTNKTTYQDYNGNNRASDNSIITDATTTKVHWTSAFASPANFYSVDGMSYTPQTLKDVLETILYPYGRIYEIGGAWMVRINVWENNDMYYLPVSGTSTRFSAVPDSMKEKMYDISLNPTHSSDSKLSIMGSDNTISRVSAPSCVKFSVEKKSNATIFEMTDKMIAGELSKYKYEDISHYEDNLGYRNHFLLLDEGSVNDPLGIIELNNNARYIRAMRVDKSGNEYSYSNIIPVGINLNSTSDGYARVIFRIPAVIRTIQNVNRLRITFKVYALNCNETNLSSDVKFSLHCNGKYYYRNTAALTNYIWRDERESLGVDDLISINPAAEWDDNDKCYHLDINEYRESGDNSLKNLVLTIQSTATEKYTIVPKIEYIEEPEFSNISIMKNIVGNIKYNEIATQLPGSGEDIDIKMKTNVADIYAIGGENANTPWAGFCDTRLQLNANGTIKEGYIDIKEREVIDIDAASVDADPTLMIVQPFRYYAGNTHYLPAAVGMNARDCNTKLKLVSTNI